MYQGPMALLQPKRAAPLFLLLIVHLIAPNSQAQGAGEGSRTDTAKEDLLSGNSPASEGQALDQSGKPMVALTFDDGPHPIFTPQLLDILNDHQVKATFYVVGRQVDNFPEIAQRIARDGHEIGNHTYSHKDLRKLGAKEIDAELDKAENSIRNATGVSTYSTRPPYGGLNQRVIREIPPRAHPIVLWTVDPLDWKKPGIQEVARRLLDGARPGAILLCHDIHRDTVEAMRTVVPALLKQGYKLVTVSEILAKRQTVDLDHED